MALPCRTYSLQEVENGGLVYIEPMGFYKHSLRPSQDPTHPVHASPFYGLIVPFASLEKSTFLGFVVYQLFRVIVSLNQLRW